MRGAQHSTVTLVQHEAKGSTGMLSDHREFHAAGIPFLKFGVELHKHYHEPTDTFARLNHGFYERVVHMLVGVATECDVNLDAIRAAHTAHKNKKQQSKASSAAASSAASASASAPAPASAASSS